MSQRRTQAQEQIADLLLTARSSLGLSMAFLSRMDGTTQHLEVVESSVPFIMKDGTTQVQETSFCQAILDKRLPEVIPDVRKYPVAMALPAAKFPRIRSYVSVPVVLSDGSVYGTFCAAGLTADRELQERDRALMSVLAKAAALIVEPGVLEAERRLEIEERVLPLIETGGPEIHLQPIVDLSTGERVGFEALSRFPREWDLPPDVVFAQAHSVGVGATLELLAITRAAEALDSLSGYVAMNLSPAVLLAPASMAFLQQLPLDRVVLELSEHDPVDDYAVLAEAIAPLRRAGMRLAIDDVGAGFSSLRHIVQTSPDVIKLDRSIVSGVAGDRILMTLVRSLVQLGADCGSVSVAEGIEDEADAITLRELGVNYGQGWHFGRPAPIAALTTLQI
ncbi:MAG: EAL domain-containing protein [bacterium]|nr:EAL domain-containing protein [bacterium]